jgi:hypothetical protein
MSDTPTYKGWRNVPSGLFSKTQLRELDLPREVGALVDVAAYVDTADWRGKPDTVPLYRLSDSRPTKATPAHLEAARARSTAPGRRCGDCGARPDVQPRGSAEGDPARRCNACHHIGRLRAAQDDLRTKRVEAVKWARDLMTFALLPPYLVHVEPFLRPASPSGRQNREPIAYRVESVDGTGRTMMAATVQATTANVKSMPSTARPLAEVVDQLRVVATAETVVTWGTDDLYAVHRLAGVEKPLRWYGGNPNAMNFRVAHWRGDIDPHTADLRWPVHPGRADRMWLLLKRMAETEV